MADSPPPPPPPPPLLSTLLLVVHAALVVIASLLPFTSDDADVLLATLAVKLTSTTQWHVLGGCVLTRFETFDAASPASCPQDEDQVSPMVRALAHITGASIATTQKGWVVLQNYIPAMACVVKLFRQGRARAHLSSLSSSL